MLNEQHTERPAGVLDDATPTAAWRIYEQRKRELAAQDLPPDVYERKLARLCEELGV